MAKTIDAAKKPNAGKKKGAKKNTKHIITAEIGKVYLSLQKLNGHCLIEFSTDCVDPDLNDMCDFVADKHGVVLEPGEMFDDCTGWTTTEVEPQVLDAIRKWIVKNTNWKLMREVKG